MSINTPLHEHILNQVQKTVISRLDFLTNLPVYMGGGTALALQLGHRTSVDFDLYNPEKFNVGSLRKLFLKKIPETKVLNEHPDGTLQLNINGIDVSIFYHPYQLIGDLVEFHPIKLASLEDISASKIAAIVQRARQRDFVDIYYLSQKLGFDKVLESAYKKFPWYGDSPGIILKSLTYFSEADADSEANRVKLFDTSLTWDTIKDFIEQEALRLAKFHPVP